MTICENGGRYWPQEFRLKFRQFDTLFHAGRLEKIVVFFGDRVAVDAARHVDQDAVERLVLAPLSAVALADRQTLLPRVRLAQELAEHVLQTLRPRSGRIVANDPLCIIPKNLLLNVLQQTTHMTS